MALPLLPVVAALNSGGHLVAHSAGGLIVYSASAGGYVAGTYISTSALASFLSGSVVAAGAAGSAFVGGAAAYLYTTASGALVGFVGAPGLFGTTVGATGVTAVLMDWGVVRSVSIFIPVLIGLSVVFLLGIGGVLAWRFRKIRQKALATPDGQEAHFSQREANLIEKMIRRANSKGSRFRSCLISILKRFRSESAKG